MIKGFYRLPEEISVDTAHYAAELDRHQKGEISADRFKPVRVPMGVYSQRGQTTFMMRIKVPAGGLTPEQMEAVAVLSEKYGNGVPHLTTRQDVQLHWVKLEDTAKVMEGLAEASLTTKGGGGNTVRNITACSDAGVCGSEPFDVAPYAIALSEYFLKHPRSHTLPRKYKIAFSGCSDDCALATVNDVGFIAATRVVDGSRELGFRVYAAGGMGAWSSVATLLEEFVPAKDAVIVAEAVLNVFHEHGNRRNKHKARLRFLVEKIGFKAFKDLYVEEFARVKAVGAEPLNIRSITPAREPDTPADSDAGADAEGFDAWVSTNVRTQSQDGFYYARIRLPLGDIDAKTLKGFAGLVRGYGEGTVRTTHDQNFLLRWLTAAELPRLYEALAGLGLSAAGAATAADVISCPGAATCNLGICLSRNLAVAITSELESDGLDPVALSGVDIKVSGCPNSCGQHPIGAIGLFGVARGRDGRMAPHYNVLVGGRVAVGHTSLGTNCGVAPARSVPAIIRDILQGYLDRRLGSELFHDYIERTGIEDVKKRLLTETLPSYGEDRDYYRDFGADDDFSLVGLGPGECGAGVFDMIDTDLQDSRRYIETAKRLISEQKNPSDELYKALVHTSRALLITRGIEPTNEQDALNAFEQEFVVKSGRLPDTFRGLEKKAAEFLSGLLDPDGLSDGIKYVEALINKVNELYESMDDTLRFTDEVEDGTVSQGATKAPVEPAESGADAAPEARTDSDVFLDLRGVKCPINYVKAKIRMETMDKGQTLLLYLDDGEPIRNVPSSLLNDGQEILDTERLGNHFELLVKKLV